MQFLIITGMSGGGKSKVADTLEDLDFYCVDNLPIDLVVTFANLCLQSKDRYNKVALVIDIRERESFDRLPDVLDQLSALVCNYKILFVDADPSTLVRRYKESRRPHPLEESGKTLEAAIAQEKRTPASSAFPGRLCHQHHESDTGKASAEDSSPVQESESAGGKSPHQHLFLRI